jgi:hypothetical protein
MAYIDSFRDYGLHTEAFTTHPHENIPGSAGTQHTIWHIGLQLSGDFTGREKRA